MKNIFTPTKPREYILEEIIGELENALDILEPSNIQYDTYLEGIKEKLTEDLAQEWVDAVDDIYFDQDLNGEFDRDDAIYDLSLEICKKMFGPLEIN